MSAFVSWIDRRFYPGIQDRWDDKLFRERILRVIKQQSVVLDLGAGAGIISSMNFRGIAARVVGIDLDKRVMSNSMLDEARVANAEHLPFHDDSFDVVFADNVVEHLGNPEKVLREVRRVLKPGGAFLFKTPNKWHYVALIARLTPHSFHQFFNRLRGRAEVDTFRTLYRANTIKDVKSLSRKVGLDFVSFERLEGRPEYLRILWPTYLVGVAYERLVNFSPKLEVIRVILIGHLSKPAQQ